jgi:hypothetical protein
MKKIPTFEGYAISSNGNKILNLSTGCTVKQGITKHYMYVTLRTSGYFYRRVAVHRLVALAYLPPPKPGQIWVIHKNGVKSDNRADNLEWISVSDKARTFERRPRTGPEHHRHVKRHTIGTRSNKLGENHPRFIGWYIYNGQKYASIREASRATGYDRRKISNFSKYQLEGWSFAAP